MHEHPDTWNQRKKMLGWAWPCTRCTKCDLHHKWFPRDTGHKDKEWASGEGLQVSCLGSTQHVDQLYHIHLHIQSNPQQDHGPKLSITADQMELKRLPTDGVTFTMPAIFIFITVKTNSSVKQFRHMLAELVLTLPKIREGKWMTGKMESKQQSKKLTSV